MTTDEFWIKWRHPQFADLNLMRSDLDILVNDAIAEHEAKKWQKYPDFDAEPDEIYLVTLSDKSVHSTWGLAFKNLGVIAFQDMPKPYQP